MINPNLLSARSRNSRSLRSTIFQQLSNKLPTKRNLSERRRHSSEIHYKSCFNSVRLLSNEDQSVVTSKKKHFVRREQENRQRTSQLCVRSQKKHIVSARDSRRTVQINYNLACTNGQTRRIGLREIINDDDWNWNWKGGKINMTSRKVKVNADNHTQITIEKDIKKEKNHKRQRQVDIEREREREKLRKIKYVEKDKQRQNSIGGWDYMEESDTWF